DLLALEPPRSWPSAAASLSALGPSECLAMALVLREAVPAPNEPTVLHSKDATKDRVVIGDVVLSEPISLSARWLVTGSLRSSAMVADDETASLVVAGDIAAEAIATEGDLWVAGNLTSSSVVLATYEAGALVVGGKLEAPVFIEVDHRVEA